MPPPGLNGIYGPRGLPPEIRTRLEQSCAAAVVAPAVRATMAATGQVPSYLDGAAFARRAAADDAFKARLIRAIGATLQ